MSSDPVPVEELFAQSAWLRRLAATLVAGEAAADDLVQETWLVALRDPPLGGRSPRPWLARIARNLAANFRRTEARRREHEAEVRPPRAALDPATLAGEIDAQRALAEAVLRLEEPLRSAVVLRYQRGLDSRAIGRLQGVPDGTVRWRLMRALELLREDLDRRSGGDRNAWCVVLAPLLSRGSGTGAGGAGTSFFGGGLVSAGVIGLALAAGLLATWIRLEPEPDSEPALAVAASRAEAPPLAATASAPLEGTPASREVLEHAETPRADPEAAECCVVGRVLDPRGRGLAGARVVAIPAQLDSAFLRREAEGELVELGATSGPDGSYSLALAGVRPFVLIAEHPGHAPVACSPVFAGEHRDLVLSAGGTLTVDVHDGSAEPRGPCAGAEVVVRVPAPEQTGELWASTGTTDALGRATFHGLPSGEARVEARSRTRLGRATIASDGALPLQCELELLATGRIDGRVVERESGRPLAGARVELETFETVETDELGRFTLEGFALDDPWRRLGARAPGRAAEFELLKLTRERPECTVDFALEPALHANGRVVDGAGRPLAGARVRFVGSVPLEPITAAYDRVGCEADALGRFAAELRAGIAYRVLVRAPGHGLGLFERGPFPSGTEALELGELALAPAASLAGSVTAAPDPGKPSLVRLRWLGDGPGSELPFQLAHIETTRADASRRFAFEGLAPGRYRLELVQPETHGYWSSSNAPAEALVELAPAEARRDVVLGALPFVEGRVHGPSGTAIGMCCVKLLALDAPERVVASAYTDSDGRFRLHPHDDGTFRLLAEDERLVYESRSVERVAPGDVLDLELGPFRSPFAIRGVLVPESGEIPPNLFVSFRDPRAEQRVARGVAPQPDGTFTIANLRDMPYDLELLDFENRFEPARLAGVRPGEDGVELRLVRRR